MFYRRIIVWLKHFDLLLDFYSKINYGLIIYLMVTIYDSNPNKNISFLYMNIVQFVY